MAAKRSVGISSEIVPGGENDAGVLRQVSLALNRRPAAVTNITNPIAGVTTFNGAAGAVTGVGSLAGLTGVVTLTAHDDLVKVVSGSDIGVYHRPGFRWPAAGAAVTVGETDSTIYGTAGQHAGAVTFPLAANYPGKKILFSIQPGSLVASGADTIDGYLNTSAEYQSDGVSAWKRIWSV